MSDFSRKHANQFKNHLSARKNYWRIKTQHNDVISDNQLKQPNKQKIRLSQKPFRHNDSVILRDLSKRNSVDQRKIKLKGHIIRMSINKKNNKTQINQSIPVAQKMGKNFYKYHVDGIIAKGNFGVIFFGHIKGTGQKIAIKRVLQDKRFKNRQLEILKQLHHKNTLQIKDYFLQFKGEQLYLYIITELYQENLHQAILRKCIHAPQLKIYLYQIFRALNYLKMKNIAHRDLNPHNIILNRNTNQLVLCDFGSAKKLIAGQNNLAYICSRAYRAPQLIFGATDYDSQIDVWSVGCIIYEMLNGQKIFFGNCQMEQLLSIIKILGTPTEQEVKDMNHQYDIRELTNFPLFKRTQLRYILRTRDQKLLDLIQKILVYSPKKRITPKQALLHPYFDSIRNPYKLQLMRQKLKNIPQLFNFSQEQKSSFGQELQMLLPLAQQQQMQEQENIFRYRQTSPTVLKKDSLKRTKKLNGSAIKLEKSYQKKIIV